MYISRRHLFSALFVVIFSISAFASKPAPVEYVIRVDPKDLSSLSVTIHVADANGVVRVAMAAHPEYDDRYYRYIDQVSAYSSGVPLPVVRESDAVWRIEKADDGLAFNYRLKLPPFTEPSREAWKPFLTKTGGMVGDLHTLMYVVGQENRPATLRIDMPDDWSAASGLAPTIYPRSYSAKSVALMLDSPVIIGKFTSSEFKVAGVPHKVVIWSEAGAAAFDKNAVTAGVRKLVQASYALFGKPPYERYTFLFQNGGQAALEHANSVNVGHDFSRGIEGFYDEVAHEYVHALNLMHVRPAERVGLRVKQAPPTGTLWWSEGATIYFADMLVIRAGLPRSEPTRTAHLQMALGRYLSSPAYSELSGELVSRSDTDPTLLGDSFASTHLQGEIFSTMLDIMILDATNGRAGLQDVMRRLAAKFDSQHGIRNQDIERAATQVCGCSMQQFFKEHIYGAKRVDYDRYLGMIGLEARVNIAPVLKPDGSPEVDLRIGPMQTDGEGPFKIRISNRESAWGRAGLHSGDQLVSINGSPVGEWSALRAWLLQAKVGDSAKFEIIRDGQKRVVTVPITGFSRPTVQITEKRNATAKQARLRSKWVAAG